MSRAFEYDLSTGLSITFNPVSKDPSNLSFVFKDNWSWKTAVLDAAKRIGAVAKRPIVLFSSGGIDSEIMCEAFLEQEIPFSVCTLDYNGLNEHDTAYAKAWCRSHSVVQDIRTLDIKNYILKDFPARVASGYVTDSVYRTLQAYMLELAQTSGWYGVIAGGENAYVVDFDRVKFPVGTVPAVSDLFLSIRSDFVLPYEILKTPGFDHEPFFYISTPELMLTYIDDPLVSFIVNHRREAIRHRLNQETLKKLVWHTYYSELVDRPKFDGLEAVGDIASVACAKIRGLIGDKMITCRVPVTTALEQLTG